MRNWSLKYAPRISRPNIKRDRYDMNRENNRSEATTQREKGEEMISPFSHIFVSLSISRYYSRRLNLGSLCGIRGFKQRRGLWQRQRQKARR